MISRHRGALVLVFLVAFGLRVSAEEKPEFRKVDRGPISQTIVERGVVEPVNPASVVCQVKARGRGMTSSSTIRWIVDDGKIVRKGDKIIELDASAIQEELKTSEIMAEQAKVQLLQAELGRKIAEEQGRSDIQVAELRIELAKAEGKSAESAVELENKALDIKVRRAKLAVELAKVQQGNDAAIKLATQIAELELELVELEKKKMTGDAMVHRKRAEVEIATATRALSVVKTQVEASLTKADADVKAAKVKVDVERAKLDELAEQIAACTIAAPADGVLTYFVPEGGRFGTQQSIIAQGEPVREGQKLVEIVDLSKMRIATRLHEAVVSQVRGGQSVRIRVDAFPQRLSEGKVKSVATVAALDSWNRNNVKLYATQIDFAESPPGLRPGMSAEVTILIAEQANALRVPTSVVLIERGRAYCIVKVADKTEKREVRTGIRDTQFIEIKEGVNEGDEVMVNPPVLPRTIGARTARGSVIVNSVKPPNAGNAARTFVESYGLTEGDLELMTQLQGVLATVPERRFSVEVRNEAITLQARLVATSPILLESETRRLRSGRFLTANDAERMENVVVLGFDIAARLFPNSEAVGNGVTIGSGRYHVVGVLANDDQMAESRNADVFVPLSTCKVRFGSTVTIRQAGTRTMEKVALHQITVITASEDLPRISGEIEELLRKRHPETDWSIKRR